MRIQGLKLPSVRFRLIFLLALLLCLNSVLAVESSPTDQQEQNLCTLRFDCKGIQYVGVQNLSEDNSPWIRKQVQKNTVLLPQGKYNIRYVLFECGLEVVFKNKNVQLIPDTETVIPLTQPSKENNGSSLEIKKQGVFLVISYTPRGQKDDEWYYYRSSPPVLGCYKGDKLIHSGTFEYG